MNTSLITVKVDSEVKKEVKKITSELGLTVSGIINAYLRQLVRDKKVSFFIEKKESPSPYLLETIKKSEQDRKNGDFYSFDDKEEALSFLERQIS